MTEASERRPSATAAWIAAALASAVWATGAFASFLPIMFSPMMFDAPGSSDNPILHFLVGAMFSFPLLCGVSLVGALVLAFLAQRAADAGNRPACRRRTLAVVGMALLPLLSVGAVVGAIVWLQTACDGSFACR